MTAYLPCLRSRVRLLPIAVAAVIACLLLPTSVAAETPTLEVLQVGWDGQVVPDSWNPVRVRLGGGDSDLTGRVELVAKIRVQTTPQAAPIESAIGAYGQDVALPAGVFKEVTLWVPGSPQAGGSMRSEGSVRLVAKGRTVGEERVEFRSVKTPVWPLIAVLADSPAIARALTQVELPFQGLPVPLAVARLAAADLPPSPERLRALGALVVQGSAATALTSEQREALRQWVAAGGHLLLLGGPDAARTASVLPADALPLSFSGADGSVDISSLGAWAGFNGAPPALGPAARFRAKRGSSLAGSPDHPLAWRFGLGQGTVTLLAADPGLEPLATWAGTPALLHKALEPALPDIGAMDPKFQYLRAQQRDPSNLLRGAVEALPPEALPGWQTVALLLGGFVLVVGPGLHLLLWRTDRRTWSWVAVPAAAVLLAGGLYYVGVGKDGRDVLANVVSYVRLDPMGDQARQDLMAGFFGPTLPALTVEVPGDAPVRAGTNSSFQPYSSYGGGSDPTEPPFRVVSGRDTRVEFDSGQWGMRTVTVSRWLADAGRVTANLRLEGGMIRGTIRNDTPYPLEDAGVLVGQSTAKLGSLAPGQTAAVALALDSGPAANPFGNRYPVSWRLFGKPRGAGVSGPSAVSVAVPAGLSSTTYYVQPGGMPEQLEVPQDPEVQRRIRLMDSIVNVPRPGPGSPSMPLTFVAFSRAPVGGSLPTAVGHPTFYLTYLSQPLQMEMSPGPFTLPPGMTPPEIVSQSGSFGGGGNGTFSWVQVQSGSLVYQFQPPLPLRSKADALAISTRQVGQAATIAPGKGIMPPSPSTTPGPAEADVFAVYNWQSAAWEPLPGGSEEVRLRPAAPYIGPDGSVRLQVSAGPDKVVMFLEPELTVEGTVVE